MGRVIVSVWVAVSVGATAVVGVWAAVRDVWRWWQKIRGNVSDGSADVSWTTVGDTGLFSDGKGNVRMAMGGVDTGIKVTIDEIAEGRAWAEAEAARLNAAAVAVDRERVVEMIRRDADDVTWPTVGEVATRRRKEDQLVRRRGRHEARAEDLIGRSRDAGVFVSNGPNEVTDRSLTLDDLQRTLASVLAEQDRPDPLELWGVADARDRHAADAPTVPGDDHA